MAPGGRLGHFHRVLTLRLDLLSFGERDAAAILVDGGKHPACTRRALNLGRRDRADRDRGQRIRLLARSIAIQSTE